MKPRLLLLALITVLLLGFAPVAQAMPILTLSDGFGNSLALQDNDNDGTISINNGILGSFNIPNFSANYSLDGTDLSMAWAGTNVKSTGPGTLTISFSQDFSGPIPYWIFSNGNVSISGTETVVGLVSGTANVSADGSVFMGPLVFNTAGVNNWSLGEALATSSPAFFTLTETAVLTFSQTGKASPTMSLTGDAAPVPEPASMLLLGAGLLGFASFNRKRLWKK
jgi:hypothetical protein